MRRLHFSVTTNIFDAWFAARRYPVGYHDREDPDTPSGHHA
jgi:hypothetical protein